jgi:hypothetical protein
MFYAMWTVMTYVLTTGKAESTARPWIYAGLIASCVAEVAMMFSNWNPGQNMMFVNMLTVHEKIWLIRSLLPAYLNGCRTVKAYLFIDLDLAMLVNIDRLVRQQHQMMLAIRNIQIGMNMKASEMGKLTGAAKDPNAPAAAASKGGGLRNRKEGQAAATATTGTENETENPVAPPPQLSPDPFAQELPAAPDLRNLAAQKQASPLGIPKFVWVMGGFYILKHLAGSD